MGDDKKNKQLNSMIRNDIGYNDISSNDQEFISSALNKGVTRRELLSWLVAAGVTITCAGTIIGTAEKVFAATPKRGGKIRSAMNATGPNDTLDPQSARISTDYVRQRAHYNNLVRLDDSIKPQPELAQEFSANSNFTEWTFKLRKDVEWHDGGKMNADDVVWTLNRHLGKNSKSKAKALVSTVKEFKKDDDYTVKAILDFPNADLATILGTYNFKILKKNTIDFQNPPGTGPYRLIEFKPGIRSLHVRNDNYWGEGPYLDELEVFAISDTVARVNALLAGDIDLTIMIDPKAIKKIEAKKNLEVLSNPTGAYIAINCLKDTAPGKNNDFVTALKLLQNREKIVRSIHKGHAIIGNDQPISVAYPDYCSKLPQTIFDPEKAKFHLKKSGITSAEIHVGELNPGTTDMIMILQQEASKIGLKLDIKRMPTDGYWGAVWGKMPLHTAPWNMRPTANTMMSLAFHPEAPWNDTHWKDERMDKLLSASRSVTDPIEREAMYCEMQTLINQEAGTIIPAFINAIDAKSKKVHGIGKNPLGPLGGCEWPEFVWIDV
jgi:peptide/nickel transport system substrate-binding protein